MPKPMRKYKADITSELQRDEIEKLRGRVADLEGHRERWRRLAWRYLDALEGLSKAAATILVQPVRDPFLVPIEMRSALQGARNRAEAVMIDDDEEHVDLALDPVKWEPGVGLVATPHKGTDKQGSSNENR